MKSQMIRLYLLLSWGLLLMLGLLGLGLKTPGEAAAYAPPNSGEARPNSAQHLWVINEIFSCADGSVQFVEFSTTFAGQNFLDNHFLLAINSGGSVTNTFEFPNDLNPAISTANRTFLVATSGFSSLTGVTPDYTVPVGFLFTPGGKLNFGPNFDIFTYNAGQLPLDGVNSLNRNFTTGVNSPKNFAGQTGSISCPAATNITLIKIADAPGTGIVEAGGILSYTITVVNSGNTAVTNALITDTVPVSTTYVPNSASNGGIFGSGIISWPNLTINPATNLTRTFQVTVSAAVTTGDKITNTAHITSSGGVNATGLSVVTVGELANRKTYLPIIFKNS